MKPHTFDYSCKIAVPQESARARLVREYATLLDHRLWERYARIAHGVGDDDDEELGGMLLDDREFLRPFMMDWTPFAKLVELIRENTAFTTTPGKKKMATPTCQLMVFLKFIGTHDSDACIENLGTLFGAASGSCFDCTERVAGALLEQYDDAVCWPSEGERNAIADRIYANYDFPNCIGAMDGTLLPLAFQPALNGEDYFTRKGSYALNALICCDDRAKVTYALAGWSVLTHGNRVWTNSKLCRSPDTFFSQGQYPLGDSAFQASQFVVPLFEKLPGTALARGREFFNTKLAKSHIRTEHCIGLIKGRFQHLKRIRVVIRNRHDLTRIIRLFLCTVAIRSLLVNDPPPSELADEVQAECANEATLEDRDTVLGTDVDSWEGNAERRDHLFHYLAEKDGRF